jgi:hypothetical protein
MSYRRINSLMLMLSPRRPAMRSRRTGGQLFFFGLGQGGVEGLASGGRNQAIALAGFMAQRFSSSSTLRAPRIRVRET